MLNMAHYALLKRLKSVAVQRRGGLHLYYIRRLLSAANIGLRETKLPLTC